MKKRSKSYTGRRSLLKDAIYWLVFIAALATVFWLVPPRTTSAYDPRITKAPPEPPAAYLSNGGYPKTDSTDITPPDAPKSTATAGMLDPALLNLPTLTPLGDFWITGYNPMDGAQCGKSQDSPYLGIGANGQKVIAGEHVAMYKTYPFGTRIYIEGLGAFEVQDRGVGPGKVDVACSTNKECYAVTGSYAVYIIEEG